MRKWRRTPYVVAAVAVVAAAAAAAIATTGFDGVAGMKPLGDSAAVAPAMAGAEPGTAEPFMDKPSEGGVAEQRLAAPDEARVGGDATLQAKVPAAAGRSIIATGSLTMRVPDVNQAAARATAVVTGVGGFVSADQRRTGAESADATLTLRVPADRFTAVVEQLAREVGKEEHRGLETQDVTEQVVDIDARITTQRAQVASARRLLAKAKSLSDLVMLERELATREADLASLEARKKRLDDLTSFSTLTLTLLDPRVATGEDDGVPGFLDGMQAGWAALVGSFVVLLTVLGALVPWLIAFGLPVVGVWWLIRRLRRRPSPPPAPAPDPTPASAAAATD